MKNPVVRLKMRVRLPDGSPSAIQNAPMQQTTPQQGMRQKIEPQSVPQMEISRGLSVG